jgi:hypothetical protein
MILLPHIAVLLKQGREYGETSIICAQEPSRLISEAISQTNLKFCHCLEGEDIEFLRKCYRLSQEQAESMNKLDVGVAITKLLSGRWPYPFRVRVPFHPIEKRVTDEEVAVRMTPILKNMNVRPRVDLVSRLVGKIVEAGRIYAPAEEKEPSWRDFNANIWNKSLLNNAEHPDWTKSERQKASGLTKGEFERLESDMARNKLIQLHRISFGKPGDQSSYSEILDDGFAYLSIPPSPLPGKGSFEHRLGQYKLSKGLGNSTIEYRGADLGWFKGDGEAWAVEIELEPNEHVLENIKRDLEAGFSRVWIVTKNKKEMESIKYFIDTWLDEEDAERVELKLFREIF